MSVNHLIGFSNSDWVLGGPSQELAPDDYSPGLPCGRIENGPPEATFAMREAMMVVLQRPDTLARIASSDSLYQLAGELWSVAHQAAPKN